MLKNTAIWNKTLIEKKTNVSLLKQNNNEKTSHALARFVFNPAKFENWIALNAECSRDDANDCVVNSLFFFDKLDVSRATELSKRTFQQKKGIEINEFLKIMYEVDLKDYSVKTILDKNKREQSITSALNEIKSELLNNEGIVLLFNYGEKQKTCKPYRTAKNKSLSRKCVTKYVSTKGLGHAVVLVKMNNELVYFDAQQYLFIEETKKNKITFEDYLKNNVADYLEDVGTFWMGSLFSTKKRKMNVDENEGVVIAKTKQITPTTKKTRTTANSQNFHVKDKKTKSRFTQKLKKRIDNKSSKKTDDEIMSRPMSISA